MSGLDIDVPVDADWTAAPGDRSVTFRDTFCDNQITLTGDPDRLIDLFETALADLVDRQVKAATPHNDLHARIQARLHAFDAEVLPPAPIESRRVCDMEAGGWVRFASSHRWFEVTGTSERPPNDAVFLHWKATNGDGMARPFDSDARLDYLSAEAMARGEGAA